MSIIKVCDIKYSYNNKTVLKNISMEFEVGKVYAVVGASGCGKTTFLSLIGGLDSPLDGQVLFQGEDIEKKGLAWHRKNNVAFIFQNYNLIDSRGECSFNIKTSAAAYAGAVGIDKRGSEAKRAETFRRTAAAGSDRPRAGFGCKRYSCG